MARTFTGRKCGLYSSWPPLLLICIAIASASGLAQAAPSAYTITIVLDGDGITDPPPGTYTYPAGSVATLTASNSDTWGFIGWRSDSIRDANATLYVPVTQDQTITAEFGQGWHSADYNHNFRIDSSELALVAFYYNVGSLHCDATTSDGYEAGPGDESCKQHDSDYMQPAWSIGLSEFLRIYQIYNSFNGRYHAEEGTEDGFAPGGISPSIGLSESAESAFQANGYVDIRVQLTYDAKDTAGVPVVTEHIPAGWSFVGVVASSGPAMTATRVSLASNYWQITPESTYPRPDWFIYRLRAPHSASANVVYTSTVSFGGFDSGLNYTTLRFKSGVPPVESDLEGEVDVEGEVEGEGEASLQCSSGSLYAHVSRPIAQLGFAEMSDAASGILYDYFYGLTKPIGGIVWWGLVYDSVLKTDCDLGADDFTLAIYPMGEGGLPDVPLAAFLVNGNGVAVDSLTTPDGRTFTLYRYEATLPEAVDLFEGWVSVYANTPDGNCHFWWMVCGEGLSGTFLLKEPAQSPVFLTPFSRAFCLLPTASAGNEGEGEGSTVLWSSADTNQDGVLSLSELLRLIQFYNVGALHCDNGSPDGFEPGSGAQDCAPHSSDYTPQDWSIGLSELMRAIQFYNAGAYHPCAEGEDGFCPGVEVN